MSKKKRGKLDPRVGQKDAGGAVKSSKLLLGGFLVLALGVVITVAVILFTADSPESNTPTKSGVVRKVHSLDELLKLTPDKLAKIDIAEMNLLCAIGLPGAENLDIAHCLATLDKWAERVKLQTQRHLYRVNDPKWADHYRHSEPYLRAEFLLQVLQEDCGVKYDMTAADNFAFNDSRVAFLHGMIPGPNQTIKDVPGGTCTSMPVMYVAIGRRLGYPLKLVTTDSHIFVRWDGMDHPNPAWRQRFNIEGTGHGFSVYEDDYYKTWPHKITDQQVKANRYLLSLTPAEELAGFLAARGHCGLDNNQIAFAARCYENAYRQDPLRPHYRNWFLNAAKRCGGYRPATPELAKLLSHHMRLADARRHNANLMAPPSPSETAAKMQTSGSPHLPGGQRQNSPLKHAPQHKIPKRPQRRVLK